MNRILKEAISNSIEAKISPEVCKGIATLELKDAVAFIDRLLQGNFQENDFGFEYVGVSLVSPEETVNAITRSGTSNSNSSSFDISENNLVMIKIQFRYDGEDLPPKYMQLLYVREGGLTSLGGSLYGVRSVLSDKSLSPSENSVFIRLLRDKINVNRLPYSVYKNGSLIVNQVLYTKIYGPAIRTALVSKARHTLLHYVLANYGLEETFRRTLGFVPTIVRAKEAHAVLNKDTHTLYESKGIKPPRSYIGKEYEPTPIAFVVENENMKDPQLVDTVMCAMFYILDHFNDLDIDDIVSPDTWRMTLGYLIFGLQNIVRLNLSIDSHLNSLSKYVDSLMVDKLYEEFGTSLGEDFSTDGFFKLFCVVIKRFDNWVVVANEISANCYDKRLEVLYFVLYDIITSINKLNFELSQAAKKYINKRIVVDKINRKLTMGTIFSVTKTNTSCRPMMYTGDHMYFKVTALTELQLNVVGVSPVSNKSGYAIDPTTLLHETHTVGGTLNAITKSRLSPLAYINIFLPYDKKTKTIKPTQAMVDKTKRLRNVLRQTTRTADTTDIPLEFNLHVAGK